MSTEELFQKAAEDVKNLKATPSNDELLELYALFKQGSVGDVNTARPCAEEERLGSARTV